MNRCLSLLLAISLFLICQSSLKAETYALQRGDVITHVNTLNIHRVKDFWKAIRHSESTMYLTVRTTTGTKKVLHVELPRHKVAPVARFGADVTSAKLEGVKVTNVRRNSPATRCKLATKP